MVIYPCICSISSFNMMMAYSLLSKHAVSLYIFGQIGKMFLFYSLMPGYSARQAKLGVGFRDPPLPHLTGGYLCRAQLYLVAIGKEKHLGYINTVFQYIMVH